MMDTHTLTGELLECLSGLTLSRIPATNEGIMGYINSHLYGALKNLPEEDSFAALFRAMRGDVVYEVKSQLQAHFLVLREEENYLIVGPCLTEPLEEEKYRGMLCSNRRTVDIADGLVHYYRQLPVIPKGTLWHLGRILGQVFLDLPADAPCCYLESSWEEKNAQAEVVDHYEELLPMRQIEQRYTLSAALMEAVKMGNYSLAYHYYRKMSGDIGTISRSTQPLRNAQNICIIMNSQLRHAVESCGIHPYLIDQFSGQIAARIESMHSEREVRRYSAEILYAYCNLVNQYVLPDVKTGVREAVLYIRLHLSENLTVKDTAKTLNINADYLSHLFVEEMKMSFTSYINRERVRLAAGLLDHTKLQVQQIAAASGYNNVSYFAKQFRRYMGVSPAEYRCAGHGGKQE